MEKQVDVIIIGAGLTGLTTGFYLSRAGKSIAIIEKENRAGGAIRTIREDGFTIEAGPNTGVYSSPDLVRLFDDLEGTVEPVFANSRGGKRWIWKNGRWHPLPSGLISAIRTPLFSFGDKLRILGEPFRKPGKDPDETLDLLVKRRMGKSFLEYAVDPFISGIYAGDPQRLVTRYALPKLYQLEQNYGSFIRGAIRKRKEPKDELTRRATREVFSVSGGLQELTDALANKIGREQIILNAARAAVTYKQGQYEVSFLSGGSPKTLVAKQIVSTIDGKSLRSLLPFLTGKQMDVIDALEYARVIEVVAAYRHWEGKPLDAFGGLVPSKENRKSLGILFTSSIFPGRCPEGGAVLSVFMGGVRHPEVMEMQDQQISELALKEIGETLGGVAAPDRLHIFRYRYAIPQYEADTGKRLQSISHAESEYPGLYLAGNIRDGIGMADRVKQGYSTAQRILDNE